MAKREEREEFVQLKGFIRGSLEDFRVQLERALKGLTPTELAWRPGPETNSIAFIFWHLTRVEDRFIQRLATDGVEVWKGSGWYRACGLLEEDIGVDLTVQQLAAFPALTPDCLWGYFDQVRAETLAYLEGLAPADFDKIPGRNPYPELSYSAQYFDGWTIGRMFRVLLSEEYQHLGHVAFLRGLQRGLDK